MKKIIIIIIVGLVIFSGCEAAGYKDGTYQGSGTGKEGEVKVSIIIKEGKISQVDIIENSETESIGSVAIEKIPQAIVEKQSTEVDDLSGATITSKAIKEGVNKALEQAK